MQSSSAAINPWSERVDARLAPRLTVGVSEPVGESNRQKGRLWEYAARGI
jgi:hypothetical protein